MITLPHQDSAPCLRIALALLCCGGSLCGSPQVLAQRPSLDPIPAGYVKIARAHGVPPSILYGISRAESDRQDKKQGGHKPWPWTLNVAGKGYYFDTRQKAFEALTEHVGAGRNVDIGPAQVSWNYHRSRLGTLWSALDPYHNLNVGAQILREMFDVTCASRCDWWRAIGMYHSPKDQENAQRYRLRVAPYLKEALN